MDPLARSSQNLQSKYGIQQRQGQDAFTGAYATKASQTNFQPKNDLGSVFGNIAHSVGNVGGQVIGGIAGGLKKMFVDEPLALGKSGLNYISQSVNNSLTPLNMLSQGRFSMPELNDAVRRQRDLNLMSNPFNVVSPEYYKKTLPVQLTAASVAAPFLKGAAVAPEAADTTASVASKLKALPGDTLKSIVTGTGAAGNSFSNPIARALGNAAYGAGYNQLVTRPTIESFQAVPQNVVDIFHGKNVGSSLANLGGIALPGFITAGGAGLKALGPKLGGLFRDTTGMFDNIKLKGGTVNQLLEKLAQKNPKQAEEISNVLKVMQDKALAEHGDPKQAAQFIMNELNVSGKLSKTSLQDFAKEFQNYASAQKTLLGSSRNLARGEQLVTESGQRLDVARATLGAAKSSQGEKAILSSALAKTKSSEEARAVIGEMFQSNPRFVANTQNKRVLQALEQSGSFGKDASAQIDHFLRGTNKVFVKDVEGNLRPLEKGGYYLGTVSKNSAPIREASQVGDIIQGHKAPLGFIGNAVDKLGLSPVGTPQGAVSTVLQTALDKRLQGTDFEGQAGTILQRLFSGMDRHASVVDPRMFTKNQLDHVLGNAVKDRGDIKLIQKAIQQAYRDVPASLVGAGPKAINALMSVPGIGKAESQYLRAKGALSYTYNPFFGAKQATKSAFISMLEGGNPLARMSKETDSTLRDLGYFNRHLAAGNLNDLMGTTAEALGGKADGAKVNRILQGIIGGTAESIARAHGKTVKQVFEEGGPLAKEMDKVLRFTVSYPKTGYLESPLAKSLNVLIFPSRFETKVIGAMGQYLAKRPPAVQMAMVKQFADAKQWSDSPQGHEWKKQNADLIKVIDYFSPTHTVGQFMRFLGSGRVADLGQIGGMPLGFVAQILKTSGVNMPDFLSQSDHADEATGQVYSQRVATTDKAKLQLGAEELIKSLFSYPGATVGLPSKTNLVETALPFLKPGQGETNYVGGTPNFTGKGFSEGAKFVDANPAAKLSSISVSPIYKKKKGKVPKLPSKPISQLR